MSHKSKGRKNKRHVPRPHIELVFAVASRLSKMPTNFDLPNVEHIEQMSRQLERGFERLKFGKALETDLSNFQDAVNVALHLITDDNFADALIHTRAAENALTLIDERKTATGNWVARASELSAIEAFLPLHDAIVGNSCHLEIEHATLAVRRGMVTA